MRETKCAPPRPTVPRTRSCHTEIDRALPLHRGTVNGAQSRGLGATPETGARSQTLPAGLKAAYCPSCSRRAVVLSPADPDVLCARCTPLQQPRRRNPTTARETP
jgi:hypothetical protein